MSASAVADGLSGSDREVLKLVQLAEQYRIIPDTRVGDLARRVGVDPDPHSWSRRADPRLWPELRHANGLEPGSTPSFRAAVDVAMASAAFVARYPHLISLDGDESMAEEIEPVDVAAARLLTEALCRASSGPYPTPSQAISSLSALAPLTLDVITDYLRSGPVGSNAVRAIDRALRNRVNAVDQTFSRQASELIKSPPGLLFRNALWMRAVRRVMWADRRRGQVSAPWAMTQVKRAIHGEQAYGWSGQVERRYALWVLAEFTPPDEAGAWRKLSAAAQPFGAHLVADLEQAREYVSGTVGAAADLFYFRPQVGWTPPAGVGALLTAHLGRPIVRSGGRPASGTVKTQVRAAAAELASEALLAPCAIRHRTAVDTLQACVLGVQDEVVQGVGGVLRAVALGGGSPDPTHITLIERCVHLLGALHRSTESIDVIEELLGSRAMPPEVVKVVILAAGQLAVAHQRHRASLIGRACEAAEFVRHDTCTAAAIHSCVAVGVKPLSRLDNDIVLSAGPGCTAMLNWGNATLADPLFRRHTAPHTPTDDRPDFTGWLTAG